jgi:hypothetical protein
MKCPACVEEGKTSKLPSPSYFSSTSMGFDDYWDEEGKRHHHDPNSSWTNMTCTQGHTLFYHLESHCPNCDFNSHNKTRLSLYTPDKKTLIATYNE